MNKTSIYGIAPWTGPRYPNWIYFYRFLHKWSTLWLSEPQLFLEGKKNQRWGLPGIVVPGSRPVRKAAEKLGLDQIFKDAGFRMARTWLFHVCLGINQIKVPAGVHCASHQIGTSLDVHGKNACTHLCSPAITAAAAVYGRFVDVREIVGRKKWWKPSLTIKETIP